MAVKNLRQRIVAFVAGLLLGPTAVWAGLESATYISDLVSSNPLSSDLASTADDHIRLLKSTIKTTFPNINNAVTATDEQLNAIPAGANPTGTIGLTAVNGSAGTYLRSDGAPALSQAIAPTWSAQHIFSSAYAGAGSSASLLSSNLPMVEWNDANSDTDDKLWQMFANTDQFILRAITDDRATASGTVFSVDRTNATVDRVAFPTATTAALVIGTTVTTASSGGQVLNVNSGGTTSAAAFYNSSATIPTVWIGSGQTGGNNYVQFYDGNDQDSATGIISTNGTTTTYGTSSDQRLKKNFAESPSAKALIGCIRVESYDWKKSEIHVDHGFVAQRLQKCAPYAVTVGSTWQVDPSKLIPAMVKYMQEQDARIARLEADAARRH